MGKCSKRTAGGPKVVLLQNGLILKIFHTRRHPWIARINPPAQRFLTNATILQTLSIPAPRIEETFWIDHQKGLSACTYQPLPGHSLESILEKDPQKMDNLLPSLAKFILRLHQLGIYFRSLHLGNILYLSDQQIFGLIDFLDLKKKNRELTNWETQRNIKHLQNYLNRRNIANFPTDKLIEHYNKARNNKD